jgi:hypothetical protein
MKLLAMSALMLVFTTVGVAVALRGPGDTANGAGSGPLVAASAEQSLISPIPSNQATRPSTSCGDDGISGRRVELIYVRDAFRVDRYHEFADRFQGMASQIDSAFVEAARRTGGIRHVRFVTDGSCRPTVTRVAIDGVQLADLDLMTAALKASGLNRIDRKYVVWFDRPGCGTAYGAPGSDRSGPDNGYNGGPNYAAIGTDCWTWHATAHELLHTLGAVQPSAPHATTHGHCWDDEDIMCYDDGGIPNPPGRLALRCPGAEENTIDCNGDDYFNVSPAPGSYLATHWNVANSLYLTRG